jgi:hypothetical protein
MIACITERQAMLTYVLAIEAYLFHFQLGWLQNHYLGYILLNKKKTASKAVFFQFQNSMMLSLCHHVAIQYNCCLCQRLTIQ